MNWALPTFDSLSPVITEYQHFTNIPVHYIHLPIISRRAWLVCSFHQHLLFLFLCGLASLKRQQNLHRNLLFLFWSRLTFSISVISPFLAFWGVLGLFWEFVHLFLFSKSTFYFCLILSKSKNTAQSSRQVATKSTLEVSSGITSRMSPLSRSVMQAL